MKGAMAVGGSLRVKARTVPAPLLSREMLIAEHKGQL